MNKYFVVSIPRTGTKSLCRMAHECGLKFKHVPGFSFEDRFKDGMEFFSDTPCYVPSFIEKICERNDFNAKFIYIDRNYDDIFNSWVKSDLYKNYIWLKNLYNNEEKRKDMRYGMQYDYLCYNESFSNQELTKENYKEVFEEHKNKVFSTLQKHNKELLIYNFTDGWKPFCDFLGCEIPNVEIPKINSGQLFEKII